MTTNAGGQGSQAPQIVRFGTPFRPFTTAKKIDFASSGENTLVAGVAGQSIYVYRAFFVTGGATNLTWKDGTTAQSGTVLSGAMPFGTNGSLMFDFQAEPWYITSPGNDLVVVNSQAVQVSGTLYYVQA